MPITEQQKKERKKHIGSSDMPAILGISPYKSAYDVWLEKTEKVEQGEANQAMQAGNALEDWVLDQAETELGKMKRNVPAECKVYPVLVANVDAVRLSDGCPIEAKTVGLYHPSSERWGEQGTDQVPERVIVQCAVHQVCLDVQDVCFVPAFIAHRGLNIYEIPYNQELANIIVEKAQEFWEKYVIKDVPPEDSYASFDYIKRIVRAPEKITEIPTDILSEWLTIKSMIKEYEVKEKEIKERLFTLLEDAEVGIADDKEYGAITFFKQARSGVNVKKLKEEFPDVYERVTRVSEYRVPRFTKKIERFLSK